MKMKIVLLILCIMILFVMFTGCATLDKNSMDNSNKESTVEKTKDDFTIGMPMIVSNASVWVAIKKSVETACNAAGGKVIFENWDYSPEGLVTASEKLISAGVDGLVLIPPADSVIPKLQKMCENAKIPFVLPFRYIKDEAIKANVESSSYYVGNSNENDEEIAYKIVKMLHEQGVNNLAVLGLKKGDISGDRRDVGIREACKDLGIKLLAETRGLTDGNDATKAVESFIASYPEMDGIFIVGGAVTPGSLQGTIKALETHNKEGSVKVGMIDFAKGMGEEFNKGSLKVVAGGNMVADPTLTSAMLINRVKGTPLSTKPMTLKINMMFITSAEDADNYEKYVEGDIPPYTAEEFKQMMFKFENDSVTKKTMFNIAQTFGLEDIMKRHKSLF
ncbi:sugar ABC transporter substrate-binding protein [Halocella sp. SP3-1]|uniref:sugar ABC transporter substrate-binding protein n=1 Tax=Halocella sp. SP3-1 TaxID=2382161 RepID=UPI000F757C1D|nr:sugar ABC transporter substrate-binding protein [Halocella sp. SP3-1]AZO96271.1 sugar ABC transporter substrate-binding protein [Halocella sp. SP3-1]